VGHRADAAAHVYWGPSWAARPAAQLLETADGHNVLRAVCQPARQPRLRLMDRIPSRNSAIQDISGFEEVSVDPLSIQHYD
jgi:hypothetical protein